jgi:phage gp36-like protein
MFIDDDDYEVQAKEEILNLLDPTEQRTGLRKAEKFAISEIRKYLGGRYDMDKVFDKEGDDRDAYIVMITIDIAIYHIYSKKAPRKIPEYRDIRYRDALNWLTDVGTGEMPTDLPPLEDEEGIYQGETRIFSLYKPNNNKF